MWCTQGLYQPSPGLKLSLVICSQILEEDLGKRIYTHKTAHPVCSLDHTSTLQELVISYPSEKDQNKKLKFGRKTYASKNVSVPSLLWTGTHGTSGEEIWGMRDMHMGWNPIPQSLLSAWGPVISYGPSTLQRNVAKKTILPISVNDGDFTTEKENLNRLFLLGWQKIMLQLGEDSTLGEDKVGFLLHVNLCSTCCRIEEEEEGSWTGCGWGWDMIWKYVAWEDLGRSKRSLKDLKKLELQIWKQVIISSSLPPRLIKLPWHLR